MVLFTLYAVLLLLYAVFLSLYDELFTLYAVLYLSSLFEVPVSLYHICSAFFVMRMWSRFYGDLGESF